MPGLAPPDLVVLAAEVWGRKPRTSSEAVAKVLVTGAFSHCHQCLQLSRFCLNAPIGAGGERFEQHETSRKLDCGRTGLQHADGRVLMRRKGA